MILLQCIVELYFGLRAYKAVQGVLRLKVDLPARGVMTKVTDIDSFLALDKK